MTEPPIEVSSDGAQPAARKTGHRVLDLVVAFSAIAISLISLFVAIEHGKTERDLVAASTWPFIAEVASNEYGQGADIAIGISNAGVGPAKVESFELSYDGEPMASGRELLRRCCALSASEAAAHAQLPSGYQFSLVDHTVLRPGETDVVFGLRRNGAAPQIVDRFSQSLSHISMRTCYCSVLGQCWLSNAGSTRTTAVHECAAPHRPFIPNGP